MKPLSLAAALAGAALLAAAPIATPSAKADTYCSRDVFLGHRGAPCGEKLDNRARLAEFRYRSGSDRALIFRKQGVVFFHCIGRNKAVVFAQNYRNRNACRMINKTLRDMRLVR
ncbi:MAG: hypothetical protein AAFN05_00620 [Pseudomonadota bacterium]